MDAQRWTVGAATITSVVEDETHHIPPELFFPDATTDDITEHDELVPDYADERGNIALRVQALVVEHEGRRVLIDPCVGNDKPLEIVFWNEMSWPFLERFAAAGFEPEGIDTVIHTHLHADHVGWSTRLVDGEWVPTFSRARYLYTAAELAYCRAGGNPGIDGVYAASVEPIFEAGLAEVVDEDADLGAGIHLESSVGHTPGHVSVWVESGGERALITGDFVHHPVQFQRPDLAEIGDDDPASARATRHRMLATAARSGALVVGTHFSTQPAGRAVPAGAVWRFVPVPSI